MRNAKIKKHCYLFRFIPERPAFLCCLMLMLMLCWQPQLQADPASDMAAGVTAFNRGDIVAAMENFRKAAEAGYAPAQVRLAYILDNSEENEAAFEWYTKAAALGDATAKYRLGEMHVGGELGKPDFEKGLEWIRAAAEQGLHAAMRSLATAYERGGLGLQVDHAKTLEWITKAASTGDPWGMQRLSRAHRRGELGLEIDEEQAKYWDNKLLEYQRSEVE